MNPVLIGAGLISFCGVVVPYSQMQAFWRYWIYYLDPFTYLVGGLLGEVLWDVKVQCEPSEYVQFSAPSGQTCGAYMADFLASQAGYLLDAESTGTCSFCQYSKGADYAKAFNLREKYYSWRDVSSHNPFNPDRSRTRRLTCYSRLVSQHYFASHLTPWCSWWWNFAARRPRALGPNNQASIQD